MSEKIKSVISFHYTLKNAEGAEMESSRDKEPLSFIEGSGNIIPGLEKALVDKQAGEKFSTTVTPEEAYGFRDESQVQRIPIKKLQFQGKLKAGSVALVRTESGYLPVQVLKAGRFHADIDRNHPLAGHTLTFDIEITGRRDATEEELEHGHVHGPGGVEH
jgi:FKBP-type peptidyl-prolyl cis-trans isomerase SlyD